MESSGIKVLAGHIGCSIFVIPNMASVQLQETFAHERQKCIDTRSIQQKELARIPGLAYVTSEWSFFTHSENRAWKLKESYQLAFIADSQLVWLLNEILTAILLGASGIFRMKIPPGAEVPGSHLALVRLSSDACIIRARARANDAREMAIL